MTVIGPFAQIVPMTNLPEQGPISDSALAFIENGAILMKNGVIEKIGTFNDLKEQAEKKILIDRPCVALPGLIDSHTHICFAGSRAGDYTKRLQGKTYLEIAAEGGGILDTVKQTRAASESDLETLLTERVQILLRQGITTCEVKSGYGLTLEDELKMLRVIQRVAKKEPVELISTCLAAHMRPPEFSSNTEYLNYIVTKILPAVKAEKLSNRVDIFVEEKAFTVAEARDFLQRAKQMGFDITIHADQFTRGGAELAAELGACSADHLEASTFEDAVLLAKNGVTATVLPGATLGLGLPFPQARMLLDSGTSLAIASDWNPGSAPMGQLLLQAALLGAQQKLSTAETFSAITSRAAKALRLKDRGQIAPGLRADLALFPTHNYRQILYHQGSLQPFSVITAGNVHPF